MEHLSDIHEFGNRSNPVIMLLPGTMCYWKGNFGGVIDELSKVLCLFDSIFSHVLIYFGKFHEGVASAQRNKSTYWSEDLACFKLRDSCIVILCVRLTGVMVTRV